MNNTARVMVAVLALYPACTSVPPAARDEAAALVRGIDDVDAAWRSVRDAYLRDVAAAWRAVADAEFERALRAAPTPLTPEAVLAVDAERRGARARIDAKLREMRARLGRMRGHLEAARVRARGLRAVLDALAGRARADRELTRVAAEAARRAARAAAR